jgi:Putative adhesin
MLKQAIIFAAASLALAAQDSGDKVTVPFRDPSGAKTLKVTLQNGSVTVKGYEGKDALIETTSRISGRERRPSHVPEGMHRIDNMSMGLDVTEENNVITVVGNESSGHLTIQVPVQTSLVLRSVNGGAITVENISGSIDANHTNGGISITNVSGSVLANTTNGKVTVSLNKVSADKAMSFTSFNGTVDVTLPVDVKANVMMKTNNGEIWSDFDIKLSASGKPPVVEDSRSANGKYKVRIDRAMYGAINGGGPEMQFVTYNGNILIHKK